MDLEHFRSYFDSKFFPFLDEKIKIFLKESSNSEISFITSRIKDIAHGGKRFRPYLAYTGLGRPNSTDTHLELFFSIELLHIFALIHDDIMDEGNTRHGVECIHRAFEKKFINKRIGNGVAILAGDLVFQWSYESILSYSQKQSLYSTEILNVFGELIREVIHGQMLDIISPTNTLADDTLIIQKMYLKTARYSFTQPIRLGFSARGAYAEEHAFAESYGRALGLAFQLQDDLIDVIGGHDKSLFLDIETKQHTLLYWFMQERASEKLAKEFQSYIGRPLTANDKKEVTRILTESGAFGFIKDKITEYYSKAITETATTGNLVWNEIANAIIKQRK